MLGMPIAKDHPDILAESVAILTKWRDTFPKAVWIRVVKSGRIAKVGEGEGRALVIPGGGGGGRKHETE